MADETKMPNTEPEVDANVTASQGEADANTTAPQAKADANAPARQAEAPETAQRPQDTKADKKTKKPKGEAAKLAAAEEACAKAREETDKVKEQMLRITAEYDNFRKRSQKEHDVAFSNGVAHAAEMLLPVLDVLEAAANAKTSDEEYKKGVVMTLDKAREVFSKMGIQEIDAMGQPFNPELHNACMQEACDGTDSGCITRVVQTGYSLNGRVIRHAMVAVAP